MVNEVNVRSAQIKEVYDFIKESDENLMPYSIDAYYGHTLIL